MIVAEQRGVQDSDDTGTARRSDPRILCGLCARVLSAINRDHVSPRSKIKALTLAAHMLGMV